jgi:hypothetical protein
MRLHKNVNLVVPCSIFLFLFSTVQCAKETMDIGYIIGLSFSSLSGLSTKKLQTQYCPVRFTWHRGSIMLPCQQKTNKSKKVIYPKSYKNLNEFFTFLFLSRIENFCNFPKVSYFIVFFSYFHGQNKYKFISIVYSTYLGLLGMYNFEVDEEKQVF